MLWQRSQDRLQSVMPFFPSQTGFYFLTAEILDFVHMFFAYFLIYLVLLVFKMYIKLNFLLINY